MKLYIDDISSDSSSGSDEVLGTVSHGEITTIMGFVENLEGIAEKMLGDPLSIDMYVSRGLEQKGRRQMN